MISSRGQTASGPDAAAHRGAGDEISAIASVLVERERWENGANADVVSVP
jgi:hypothetical protein